ncbi:MAG: DUF4037 domain-containing protein [Turicibacter sp.]|nr:DUF4037 domain-containing protein [Turicibacter sp.]MCI9350460.1 DUF4037 domain-containing protein [Turicibacter sp.]
MINVNEILHRLIAEFKTLEEVTGITMSGSKFSNYQDELSDINIVIYFTQPIAKEKRRQILVKFSESMELDCPGEVNIDHCSLRDFAVELDLCYLEMSTVEKKLMDAIDETMITRYTSTQIAYFVHNSNILFDRDQQLSKLKEEYTSYYSDQMRQRIVSIQYPLLKQSHKSYYIRFERALEHRDRIHLSNLLNGYLKCYLEIIFALNRQYYPTENRIIQITEEICRVLPKLMKEHIELLFVHAARYDKQLLSVIDLMVQQLTELLQQEGLL